MVDINQSAWAEVDSSNNSASPNGWASGTMLPSQVEPTARAMMGATKRFYDHINGVKTSAGTANVQTLTYDVAPAALVTGDRFLFKVGASLTNTGATTLNINGLGATTIQSRDGAALVGNELVAGQFVEVVYDGTNFRLFKPSPATTLNTPSNPTGTTSLVGVLMGFSSGVTLITPTTTGRVLIIINGRSANNNASGGVVIGLRYGTGTGPANGASSGTGIAALGANETYSIANTSIAVPFSLAGVVSGLTIGQGYWIDLILAATTGGTATVSNVTLSAVEL